MKKVILFLLILININVQLLFSQVNHYQLDKIFHTSEDIQKVYTHVLPQRDFLLKEIYYQDWDGSWKNIWRDTLFYDENNNLTQISRQGYRYNSEKDTFVYVDSKRSVFNYDLYNNISEVYHSYEFLGWAVARMEKYQFNNNKYLTDEQYLVWNFEFNYWGKESRHSYFFNGNNKLDSMFKYHTDKDGFTWNDYSKIFYTYINDDLVHSNEILYYGLEYVKSNYYYDVSNNFILKTDSIWDGSNER